MKYGDTLQQRSVPLWETYNVDYNDIKRLIKLRTTQGQGQARAIPGSNNEAKQLQEFEAELYRELRDQHQRIDLFVRSKAGEIARRLAHLDKQIAQLKIRSFASGQTKISIKRLEKFSKAEAATLKAGEEIQSLSQFVGAQRLAFQKLLKKFKKWTGSSELGKRFRQEILDRSTSFSKRDFQPLLAQWTEVLTSVRAPFDKGANSRLGFSDGKDRTTCASASDLKDSKEDFNPQEPNDSSPITSNSTTELQSIWDSSSNVEIDTALAVLPLGAHATNAVYWVHPDNIVQVHVLLLQYTRLQKSNNPEISLDTPPTSGSSRQGSPCINASRPYSRTDEEIGLIIFDDLQRFAKRRNGETIGDSEDRPGAIAEKAAVSIRYSCNGDALIVVDTVSEARPKHGKPRERPRPKEAKVEKSALRRLLDGSGTIDDGIGVDSKSSPEIFEWLRQNQEVQPLVQIQSRRTRFLGLKNRQRNGVWATLDKDILMHPVSRDSLVDGTTLLNFEENGKGGSSPFPHAVLEVRVEGDLEAGLVAALDASHITERVRGFSLETHAVAKLCKPPGMPRPFWLPALEQDIRKVPAATTTNKTMKGRASQGRTSPEQPSTRATSVSASSNTIGPSGSGFSTAPGDTSVTSAPENAAPPPVGILKKKRRQSNRKRILEKGLRKASQSQQQRYWNEFDDGSEGSDNEAYTILVDPNATSTIPGAATMAELFSSLRSKISTTERKVASFLRPSHGATHGERESLIDEDHTPSVEDSDVSDEECSPKHAKSIAQRRYTTFPTNTQSYAVRAREALLFRSCLASFAASFVLLLIATILKTTGRRKAATTVDAGVIIGVAASYVFAIIGVGSMVGRKDTVGWPHRSIVILIFVCIVLAGGALLAALS